MGYDKNYGSYGNVAAEVAEQTTMTRVYGWMTGALLLSAVTALLTASSEQLLSYIFGTPLLWVMIAAEVGLVWWLSSRIERLAYSTAVGLFLFYSVLNGMTLSSVLIVYSGSQITSAFVASSLTFGTMSLYGALTKRDLTGWGSFLYMGLIGLVVASLVNIFWSNSTLDWIITYVGVFLFVGLTAYDTQKIKQLLRHPSLDSAALRNYAIVGALNLYLDFVNLFLYILRLFARRD